MDAETLTHDERNVLVSCHGFARIPADLDALNVDGLAGLLEQLQERGLLLRVHPRNPTNAVAYLTTYTGIRLLGEVGA